MAEFFHGRRLRYHVSVKIESRWQLVAVLDDGRDQLGHEFERNDLDRLETEVRRRAHAALAMPGVQAVQVVRERIRADGYAVEEPFLVEEATAKPVDKQVANYAGPVPVCERFEDLLERPALHAIGLVMRPLLDKLGMTPIELVTLKAASSPVKRAANGVDAAIRAAARLQAEALGQPVRLRIAAVEKLADECRERVRLANLIVGTPTLGTIGLDRFVAAVADRFAESDRRFWALRGLSEFIAGLTSYMMKLDRLLKLNQPTLGPASTELLDEAVACLVDHSDVMYALLGHQADLRVALFRLAELAEGKPPTGSGAPEAAAQLALLIAEGRLDRTRDAVWDRLARSLAGQRSLAGGSLKAELAAIAELQRTLLPRVPAPFQADAAAVLLRRQRQTQQAILDSMER
jgi:hypothetical protein